MPTIFVIDDDPDVLKVTLDLFTRHGYEAVGASNGLDAIRILSKVRPHLIITDIVMPQMDGYKFLKKLKEMPLTAAIPILVITGKGKHMADSFETLGIEGFMTKPFSAKQLLTQVEQILEGKDI